MSNQLCPMCNQPLRRRGKLGRAWSAYSGWRQTRVTTMQTSALTPFQPTGGSNEPGRYFEAERRQPVRPQNLESDFLVPMALAAGTGFFATVAAGWFAWTRTGFTWDMALGVGIIAAGGTWVLTVLANRKLLWSVESIINSDLDNDGTIGQPEARPVALEVLHRNDADNFRQMFRFDLPAGITEADFREFAGGVTNEHRGLAESAWIGSGKPFSRQSYSALMETLESAGLARWKDSANRAAGRELTPAGGRALRTWLQTTLTHSRSLTHSSVSGDYQFIDGVG